ncbi:trace amine-associated receptor 1-like [Galendromus occidentalis]|uniref:Trace amine-associated receptor 1-like n=1 Tax=Galendromus occidentalis TaxID=34638 RepID=A0AAJ6QUJ1_9ACAR|nr:trace amine-associated receptor 1-like [Galendromus occidentalis]
MFLDFLVPWRVLKAPVVHDWAYLFCNVTPATSGWLVATSSYIVLVITVERFYAVCFPMQSRTNSEGFNPTLVSAICLILGFITFYPSRYILMTQTVGLQTESDFTPICYVCKYVKVDGFLYVYYKIRGTLTRTLPTIIVAFLNTCTVISLRRHQHNRSSTLNQQPGAQEQAEDRIKLIIMSITTIFVLCYTPTCIKDIFAPPNGASSLWYETFRLGALLLLHVNTACNFYVYCMCSPAIRQELRKVFFSELFKSSRCSLKSTGTYGTASTSRGSVGSLPKQ